MAARALVCLCLLAAAVGLAQTTQGLIAGRIVDSRTGRPVGGARVEYVNSATGTSGTAPSGASGDYALPLLSPGAYRLRVTAADYQAQEVQELELAVAARLELNFRMRPLSDVWEAGQYRSVFLPGSRTIVTFYGPDVDSSRSGSFEATRGVRGALESTVSDVIHPSLIRDLPLAGRDVYTMLLSQPAATADSGTARGIGLAIMGQRPESSNFLLDGFENNNYLTTGALAPVAPEAIQEYRVSTNNFSAEYGRTSGFVANAVSKSGGNDFHGILYTYLRNEALNANDFQRNLAGLDRAPAKERQMGFQVGGPVRRDRLFFSSAFEHLRSRGRADTQTFLLPTPQFTQFIQPVRQARQLLERYPSPAPSTPGVFNIAMPFNPPVSVDRWLTIQRLDYQSADGRHRIMGRGAAAHVGRPDFIWTPYTEFNSGLGQDTWSIGVSHIWTLQPGLLNEFKIGRNRDDIGWDRAHPEVPTLVSGDGTLLPGSPALYAYRNDSHTWEILNSLVWTRGRHIVTTGGGFLNRRAEGYLTGGRDGYYQFGDNIFPGLIAFSLDRASLFRVAVDRGRLPGFGIPDFDRQYRYNQGFFFLQDTFRATSRLTFNAGLRYERFGAPRNTGATKDLLVDFGAGGQLTAGAGADQRLYEPDRNDWAGRFGFSYDLTGRGNTLLRGAYGIFHDRPYDNLWQNLRGNRAAIPIFLLTAFNTNFMEPVGDALQRYTGQLRAVEGADFPRLTAFNPSVRTPYAQTYFLGVQQRVGESWSVEVNGAGSLGRKLLVTDTVNRFRTLPMPEAPYGLIRSRDSQGLELPGPHCHRPLPGPPAPFPGVLHLEPRDRSPERPPARGLLRPDRRHLGRARFAGWRTGVLARQQYPRRPRLIGLRSAAQSRLPLGLGTASSAQRSPDGLAVPGLEGVAVGGVPLGLSLLRRSPGDDPHRKHPEQPRGPGESRGYDPAACCRRRPAARPRGIRRSSGRTAWQHRPQCVLGPGPVQRRCVAGPLVPPEVAGRGGEVHASRGHVQRLEPRQPRPAGDLSNFTQLRCRDLRAEGP
ncbi:MAG: TonB-dependent receptor [Bryobacterales bacterium]|nr:TonB-dependent receptor [Bryobacterales bacterium]